MLKRIALGSCIFTLIGIGFMALVGGVFFVAITSAQAPAKTIVCTTTSGSTQISCVSTAGVQVGSTLTGSTDIPAGTKVTVVNGNWLTLSNAATVSEAVVVFTVVPPPPPNPTGCPTPMPAGQTCVIDYHSEPDPGPAIWDIKYVCTVIGVNVPAACKEPLFSDVPPIGFLPYSGIPGQCYWWAYYNYPHAGLPGTAYAYQLWNAWKPYRPEGSTPRDGALVIYSPNAFNNSGMGHVAVVVSVNSANGTFVVSEMNWFGNYIVDTRLDWNSDYRILGFIYRTNPVT